MSENSTFLDNSKPTTGICSILKYIEFGKILDLGCGNCRNSIYLTKNGTFNFICGVDLDEDALILSNKNLSNSGVKFSLEKKNILNFKSNDEFNIILNSFTTPYLDKQEILNLVLKNKKNTKISGLNYYSFYVDDVVKIHSSMIKSVSIPREFENLYRDWELVEKKMFEVNSIISKGVKFKCCYLIFRKK